jgi:SAM-dependent methyltransferase
MTMKLTELESRLQRLGGLQGCRQIQESFWSAEDQGGVSPTAQPHCATEGVSLSDRSKVESSTSYWEWRVYKEFISEALAEADRNELILDLGAGDGRITRLLLANGFSQVVACDCNLKGLERFYATLSPPERQKILLLHRDIDKLSFPPGSLGGITAIESLYFQNELYESFLERLVTFLRPGGLLVHSEPLLEGALIPALAVGDWAEVEDICRRGVRHDMLAQGRFVETRLFSLDELAAIHQNLHLHTLRQAGIPSLNHLAVTMLNNSALSEAEKLGLLRCVRDRLGECSPSRCAVFATRKAA